MARTKRSGEVVPLPQTPAMQDWGTDHPVGEDSRGGSGEQGQDPFV
jgi:hypothetical protein